MTFGDCWISAVDDQEFKELLAEKKNAEIRRANRIDLMPRSPASTHCWLPLLKDWAAARDLAVHYIDPLWIEVPVSRAQLLQFLDDTYGPDPDAGVRRLRSHIWKSFRDDHTYLIVADEF